MEGTHTGKKKRIVLIIAGICLLAAVLAAAGMARHAKAQRARQAQEYAEMFEVYRPYGLVFDPEQGRLYYQGALVRYFEDVVDAEHFKRWPNQDGEVDVYAVRDEAGKLTGVAPFGGQSFTARTPELQDAVCELQLTESVDGYTAEVEAQVKDALEAAYAVYQPYGLTYDRARDRLYYEDRLVGYFEDEARKHTFGPFDGSTLTIYAVRDAKGDLTGLDIREAGA